MSFVRSSKFRHVFAETPKAENTYSSIKISKAPFESNMSAVNAKFLAVAQEAGGGGSFIVTPLSKIGRVDLNHPKVCGHKGQVMDVEFNPFNDNEIASASEDCTVKIWEIPDGGLSSDMEESKITLSGHEKKALRIHFHPSAENVLASCGVDKRIIIWNTKTTEQLFVLDTSDAINSFSWSYNGKYIAASMKKERGGQKLAIYNVREQKLIQETDTYQGSKPSMCVFLGLTNLVLTCGSSKTSERQYSVWNAGDLSKPLTTEKLDSSSGVLMPFWDDNTQMFYLVGKGDSTIRLFEINDKPPYAHGLTVITHKFAQRSVCALPRDQVDYMKCEVMRFYRIIQTKDRVEPTPMIVPRKSEMFQDDIFDTCFASKPALSAEEWAGGVDKDPLLLKYTRDGLVELSEKESQRSKDISFKEADKPKEKAAPEVLKRWGSPEPIEKAVLVTKEDYKAAYEKLLKENEKLKKEIAELKGR